MDVAIDPEDLIVDEEFVPQTRFRGFFLGKRVPYSLLKRAFGLPGKALAVYLSAQAFLGIFRDYADLCQGPL